MKHLLKVQQSFAKSLIFLLPLVSLASHAAPLQPVPPGLNPGDQYRLAFLTQGWANGGNATTPGRGIRDAVSNDIDDYNAWVTERAVYQTVLADLGTTWKAIASTESIDARDNTGTNPTNGAGVPIYNLDGALIATDNNDLWDGTIAIPLSFNERGYNSFSGVWTGSLSDGTKAPTLELGSSIIIPPFNSGMSNNGHTKYSDSSWMVDTNLEHAGYTSPTPNNNFAHMYVMSDVLTVQAASAVPVPAAAWLFASALGLLAGTTKRRR